MVPICMLKQASAALIVAMVTLNCHADADEAWLLRATLPEGVQPLLAVIVDTSAATAGTIAVAEPYDAERDYGVSLPAAMRCNAPRVYWRRAAGPAPDCLAQAGLEFIPSRPMNGLQCDAARATLGLYGFFVASRAAHRLTSASSSSISARLSSFSRCGA